MTAALAEGGQKKRGALEGWNYDVLPF